MDDKLWPTFKKFSMSTEPITVSPPRFVPLTLWVDGQYTDHATCSQYELLIHFTRISTNYTSLETNDRCFRNRHMFSEELVRIFPSHKQEHLLGTIVVTKKLNLIGNICFNSHRTSETHFLHQSASTEAIFSSTWSMHAKSLRSEKLSVTTPTAATIQGFWRKFEGRCFWISYNLPSNFTIRIPPQL